MPTDKQRLDWLQRSYQGVSPAHDHHKGFKAGDGGIWGSTLRKAIDAAMNHKERGYEAAFTCYGVSSVGSIRSLYRTIKLGRKKKK